jgi:hypothetical protein
MNSTVYQKLEGLLAGRQTRRVDNNTYVSRSDDNVILTLHNIVIVTATSSEAVFNTAGWLSRTTKRRFDSLMPEGIKLVTEKGIWVWKESAKPSVPFRDGDKIKFNGQYEFLSSIVKPGDEKAEGEAARATLRQIKGYAQLCASSVPLEPPGPGDCVYCSISLEGNDHIALHMEEGYVVPSLVRNALMEADISNFHRSIAFSSGSHGPFLRELAGRIVERAVGRYIRRRFGLPL